MEPEIESFDKFIEQVKGKGGDKIDLEPGQEEFKVVETGEALLVYLTNYKSDTPRGGVVKFSEVNHVIGKSEEKTYSNLENRNTVTVYARAHEFNSKLPEGLKINFPLLTVNMNEQRYTEWLGKQNFFGNDPFSGKPKPLVSLKKEKGLIQIKKG